MTISAAQVNALRQRTNAPLMECKRALTETNGDMEKAVEYIRKTSKVAVDKGAGRESAPVAKNDLFVRLTNDLARQAALKGAASVEDLLQQPLLDDPKKTVKERIEEVIGLIRENMRLHRITRLTGLLGSYVHHDGSV